MTRALLPPLLCAALVTGCAVDPPPPTRAFLVRHEPDAPPAPDPAGPSIQVVRVEVASHIQGLTVVREDGQVDTLVYIRWASPVAEMVERWLRDALLQTGRVRGATGPALAEEGATELLVSVARFEVEELPGGAARARVLLEAWRRDRGAVRGWWPLGRHEGVAPVEAASGAAYQDAMALALDAAVRGLIAEILAPRPGPGG